MKDIYEILNDVDIDENEIEIMQVSDIEKANVKRYLKKSLKKNKGWKKKGLVAAALCCVVIGSVGAVGITNPAYAAEIPVVGDIFRFLDNGKTGVYDKYKENSNEINVTKVSNGISITIKNAIYDGETLSYTYEIKGDKDLGKRVFISGYESGFEGGSHTEKVGANTYIGQFNIRNICKEQDGVSCKIDIRKLKVWKENDKSYEVKGVWDFNIDLKAVESKKEIINRGIEKEGINVNIDSISKTKMSFIIYYSDRVPRELIDKWFFTSLKIEAKDDLGDIYEGVVNGGHGEDESNMTYSETFGKLDENATKLIITPKMHLCNIDDEEGEIKFDDIIIDLEK